MKQDIAHRFTLRFMAARPLTFLCFAHAKRTYGEQSKQKKGDPGCRFGCAKLPSLHMLLAAGASRCAPDRPCFRQNHVPFGCAKGMAARIMRFRQPEQNNL
ncbi:hypothetical protein [Paralysiella testudinis]|uniref:Uncharacterized protein n=1 Tax=Paralysiella testudinis TaxID=2809020 RepID=A0A892ZER1_9NEIS|nr:hypothetical protein [Paralysiella testudinis]QRQ81133.1 hypothetical protein JQU52_10425 [Paralysiella testudinis]